MAKEQIEADEAESSMGMSQDRYDDSVSHGETMPIRESKKRK
jgi:hypothetical protein